MTTELQAAALAEDAVEALYKSMASCYSHIKLDPEGVLKDLAAQGYSLRRKTMTDKQLWNEAVNLAGKYQLENNTSAKLAIDIFELTKKYRG